MWVGTLGSTRACVGIRDYGENKSVGGNSRQHKSVCRDYGENKSVGGDSRQHKSVCGDYGENKSVGGDPRQHKSVCADYGENKSVGSTRACVVILGRKSVCGEERVWGEWRE